VTGSQYESDSWPRKDRNDPSGFVSKPLNKLTGWLKH